MNWQEHLAHRARKIKPSSIREILKLTQGRKMISFGGGMPAPGLFPVERLTEATNRVLAEQGAKALQYSTTEGYLPLREWVASRLSGSTPDNVQVVSGSQQGLDMIARILLDPGDKVVVTAPTYMGALLAFDAFQASYRPVDIDDDGMELESLEHALQQGAKLIYTIPNFDNPTGITMSLARRQGIVALARRYGVPIYEDNPYGELRFEGEDLPHLYELAPDIVIYGGTFSKIVVPGFRLGWLVADPELLTVVTRSKQASDLHTSTFTQMVAFEVLRDGFIDGQVEEIRSYYKGQRDAMLSAIDGSFPKAVNWTKPRGGMFIWVTLPEGRDSLELLEEAIGHGVAFVPGAPFYTDDGGRNAFRLSYTVAKPEEIESGIQTLGDILAGVAV